MQIVDEILRSLGLSGNFLLRDLPIKALLTERTPSILVLPKEGAMEEVLDDDTPFMFKLN